MSKQAYEVVICENYTERFVVKADSIEEAQELALSESSFLDPDVSDANEVKS